MILHIYFIYIWFNWNPKGVAVTNKNICHYVREFINEFKSNDNDIMMQYSVCSFDIFVEEVFAS